MTKRHWVPGWACAFAVLLCLLVINPRAGMGINDDWSYAYSANQLAGTGHMLYNGWSTASLGVQLYLGALFIKLFGFSFTAVRASSMLLGVLSAPLCYAILQRCGVRPWNAVLGTLTFVLSPLFLPLASTYMSDGMAQFFLLLFLYGCIRSFQSQDDRTAILWLVFAAVMGYAGGTIRQIAWLGILVSLPCLVLQQRRRRFMLPAGAVLWLLGVAAVFATMHWFNHQQYAALEKSYYLPRSRAQLGSIYLPRLLRSLVSCDILIFPVLVMIAGLYPVARRNARALLAALVGVAGVVTAVVTHHLGADWWSHTLQGGYLSDGGVLYQPELLGPRLHILPPWLQVVLALLVLLVTAVACAALLLRRLAPSRLPDEGILWSTAPFILGYLVLVHTRSFIYDRYYLPLLFLAILFLLRWHQSHTEGRRQWLPLIPLVALAWFAVAGAHDVFAEARARLAAANELRAAGVSRTEFHAGFQYDGWTEIEQNGHINEPRIYPAGLYHMRYLPEYLHAWRPTYPYTGRQQPEPGERNCYTWFFPYVPSIHAKYMMETQPGYCFPLAPFQPVTYRTWLPFGTRTIYISKLPQQIP